MAFASFTSAAIILAASINSDLRRVAPLWADKPLDETINNVGTLQDDDDLIIPVEANATYWCMLDLVFLAQATPDFKLDFTAPASSTMVNWKFMVLTGSTTVYGITGASGAVSGIEGTGADRPVNVWGRLTTAGTAGNLRLRWSQNTANASDTIVRAGSCLWAIRTE